MVLQRRRRKIKIYWQIILSILFVEFSSCLEVPKSLNFGSTTSNDKEKKTDKNNNNSKRRKKTFEYILKKKKSPNLNNDDENHPPNFLDTEQQQQQQQQNQSILNMFLYLLKEQNFVMSPPRDLLDGMLNAMNNLVYGYFKGINQVLDSIVSFDEIIGNKNPMGYIGSAVSGIGEAVLIAAGGLVTSAYQILRGSWNTPQAIHEVLFGKNKVFSKKDGRWKDYYLDRDNDEVNMLLTKQQQKQQEQQDKKRRSSRTNPLLRRKRKVKDKEYYSLLKVSTDASKNEIKQAYRQEALRIHPDKNLNEDAEDANHRFQRLSSAYRVLANDDTRRTYDSKGKCYIERSLERDNSKANNDTNKIDPYTFFAITFGSDKVRKYVGELKIASLMDDFFLNLKKNDIEKVLLDEQKKESNNNRELLQLQQRRRVLDIALFLRRRILPYVEGRVTKIEFQKSCQSEATGIINNKKSNNKMNKMQQQQRDNLFADSFLLSIGRSIMLQSDKFLGKAALASIKQFGVEAVGGFQSTTALFNSVTSYAGIITEAIVAEFKNSSTKPSFSSSSCKEEAEENEKAKEREVPRTTAGEVLMKRKKKIRVSKLLKVLWQVNDRDIRDTLSDAVNKVLKDKSCGSPEIQTKRAEALSILGHEFYTIGKSYQNPNRWQDEKLLREKMGAGFRAAILQQLKNNDDGVVNDEQPIFE